MNAEFKIKRTVSDDAGFQLLISNLDNELWNELHENQATYDQYNKVPGIQTAVILYINERPVACGCFKEHDKNTVEIKRMFVEKEYRGKGLSKLVLEELEKWAVELGFRSAVLETSVHFKVAQDLYAGAGYGIIENYDQYKGLKESVCMKKRLNPQSTAAESTVEGHIGDNGSSPFWGMKDIEYFLFEEDFVEKNVRCIPMIVRFKMDKAGIKLKLNEWSKFTIEERIELTKKSCNDEEEIKQYNKYLSGLIKSHTGNKATTLEIDQQPAWVNAFSVPEIINEKMKEFDCTVSAEQWKVLTKLQRYALIKLSRPGHESKNFIKALKEFGLMVNEQKMGANSLF